MLLPAVPAVTAVTVTLPEADVAVTAATLALILPASAAASAARFTDAVALSVLVENVVPAVVPDAPPLRCPVELRPGHSGRIVVATVMLLPASPVAVAVMVTTAPAPEAPTPTAAAPPNRAPDVGRKRGRRGRSGSGPVLEVRADAEPSLPAVV